MEKLRRILTGSSAYGARLPESENVEPSSCVSVGLALAGFDYNASAFAAKVREISQHAAYLESLVAPVNNAASASSQLKLQLKRIWEDDILAASRITLTWLTEDSSEKEQGCIPKYYVLEMKKKHEYEQVYRDPPSGDGTSEFSNGFTLSNLAQNRRFDFRLIAYFANGTCSSTSLMAYTLRKQPKAPQAKLCGFQFGLANYMINWLRNPDDGTHVPVVPLQESTKANTNDPPAEVARGDCVYQLVLDEGSRVVYEGRAGAVELTSLVPGVRYTIKVRVSNGCGRFSAFSPTRSFVTKLPPPSPPKVEDTTELCTGLRVSWDPYQGKSVLQSLTYVVKILTGDGQKNTFRVERLNFDVKPVSYDETYTIMVKVEALINHNQDQSQVSSAWSQPSVHRTPCRPPSQPVVIQRCHDSVFIRWFSESEAASAYIVEQKEVPSWKEVHKSKQPVAVIRGLDSGKRRY